MPQNLTMLVIAVLLGLATGVLFGYTSKKTDKQDRSGKDPTAPVVLAEISGLVGVYTLGACAFILGYIGWWGGTEPPEGSLPGLLGAFRNPGLVLVLGSWLAGFGAFRTWKG
ncbi:MAG: hypothetical protein H7A35_04185 [Planctomycetales bacterium]|nr:hypothetical protein [bacterium]UNM09255.1 MAG: hypothetical protein H7A35_04185 [Planctomycetales bacterium]